MRNSKPEINNRKYFDTKSIRYSFEQRIVKIIKLPLTVNINIHRIGKNLNKII